MRVLITLLTALSVGALLALDNPQGFLQKDFLQNGFWRISGGLSEKAAGVWNDKDVRIDGLRLLSRAEVERLLPLDRSVAWWHANATEIQAKLSQNSWISGAKVTSCRDSWRSRWGCFLVSIQERQPMFLATMNGDSWVIDGEGAFLAPLGDLKSRSFSGGLVALKGVAVNRSSPDLMRVQLSVASRLCETLEREVAKPIVELEFLEQGDFAISFQGLLFPIVFAAGQDAKVPLAEQGARCAALLRQLAPRFSEVARIDLAFNRVGVVQFKSTPTIQKEITAG